MRTFTLICSLILLGIGGASYYGWERHGWDGPVLSSAVPAAVGGLMTLMGLIALIWKRLGLTLAFFVSVSGLGLALGRLFPAYQLEGTFRPEDSFTRLLLAMGILCFLHVLVSVLAFFFRARPLRKGRGRGRRKTAGDPAGVTS